MLTAATVREGDGRFFPGSEQMSDLKKQHRGVPSGAVQTGLI